MIVRVIVVTIKITTIIRSARRTTIKKNDRNRNNNDFRHNSNAKLHKSQQVRSILKSDYDILLFSYRLWSYFLGQVLAANLRVVVKAKFCFLVVCLQ